MTLLFSSFEGETIARGQPQCNSRFRPVSLARSLTAQFHVVYIRLSTQHDVCAVGRSFDKVSD